MSGRGRVRARGPGRRAGAVRGAVRGAGAVRGQQVRVSRCQGEEQAQGEGKVEV